MSRAVSPLTICRTFMDSGIRGSKNRTSPFTLPTHEFHSVSCARAEPAAHETEPRACLRAERFRRTRTEETRALAASVPPMSLVSGTSHTTRHVLCKPRCAASGPSRYCFSAYSSSLSAFAVMSSSIHPAARQTQIHSPFRSRKLY